MDWSHREKNRAVFSLLSKQQVSTKRLRRMKKCLCSLALALLCACQNAASAIPTATIPATAIFPAPLIAPTYTPEPSLTPTFTETARLPDPIEEQAWASGPHARPVSATSQTVNLTAPAVPCGDCHQRVGGVITGSKIAWWDTATQRYQAMADVNGLCEKCHKEIQPENGHNATQSAVHEGFECTDCHDPHTTTASCSNSLCHQNIIQTKDRPPSTPTGGHPQIASPICGGATCHPAATAAALEPRSVHGAIHMNVTCQACHGAGNLKPGPGKDGGPWVTWQAANQSGEPIEAPCFPHIVQLEVDCQRCHFSNDPWGLPLGTNDEFQR